MFAEWIFSSHCKHCILGNSWKCTVTFKLKCSHFVWLQVFYIDKTLWLKVKLKQKDGDFLWFLLFLTLVLTKLNKIGQLVRFERNKRVLFWWNLVKLFVIALQLDFFFWKTRKIMVKYEALVEIQSKLSTKTGII